MSFKRIYDMVIRPRPPIGSLDDLADFIDQQAAFLVQKGIYEYSRARAGHYSKVLFDEQGFVDAVEAARWQAYPLGLAMVAELVEGTLRPADPAGQKAVLRAISGLALYVFDRYSTPPSLGQTAWRGLRADLAVNLDRIGLHPPKRAMDIPEPFVKAYYDLMPIHKSLRGGDYPTTKSYLKITLCNIHDELTRRMDLAAIEQELRSSSPVVQRGAEKDI